MATTDEKKQADLMVAPSPMLTISEAAAYARKTPTTIHNWIRRGRLPKRQPGGKGGHVLIAQSDLDRLLAPVDDAKRPA
jgi:excisionase family DNA binding protein